jgi:hypothetical protein
MDKGYGILIVSVTILVLCFVGTVSATNWSVDGSGGADFTRIQDAINNAKDGDTILVYSCIYYENVVVDKSVTLKGIGHPVVDARRCGKSVVTLRADGITVEGFNVTKGSWEGAGITISSSNNTITGNTVCHTSSYYLPATIPLQTIISATTGAASISPLPATTLLQATMSATTTGAASISPLPATTQLQVTMSATTRKASASPLPATTTQLQATMSATTTGKASTSSFQATPQ